MTGQAGRVAEDDGADHPVDVLLRPRARQDALRAPASFRTEFCTQRRAINTVESREYIIMADKRTYNQTKTTTKNSQ